MPSLVQPVTSVLIPVTRGTPLLYLDTTCSLWFSVTPTTVNNTAPKLLIMLLTTVEPTVLSVTSASMSGPKYKRPRYERPRDAVRFVSTNAQLLGNCVPARVPTIGNPDDALIAGPN